VYFALRRAGIPMKNLLTLTAVAIVMLTGCVTTPRLAIDAPPSVTVGERFQVTLRTSPTTGAGHARVIVEGAGCRSTFEVQHFDRLTADGLSSTGGSDGPIYIPVVVSSRQAEGTVSVTGVLDDRPSPARVLSISAPKPAIIDQHARRLTDCVEPSDCLREIEYFRYVGDAGIADRLIEILPKYAHAPAAAEAVFMQGRAKDAKALRSAAGVPNVDATRLLSLAERLETGIRCPDER
jgi:hypothetical protein